MQAVKDIWDIMILWALAVQMGIVQATYKNQGAPTMKTKAWDLFSQCAVSYLYT